MRDRIAALMSFGTDGLMVFTGDTLARPARRRGIAIEPMSCPPNALVTGTDLVWLAPGEAHRARWGIAPG